MKKSEKLAFFVRWVLTSFLLMLVWRNAHWSVGLCISLGALRNEIIAVRENWARRHENFDQIKEMLDDIVTSKK